MRSSSAFGALVVMFVALTLGTGMAAAQTGIEARDETVAVSTQQAAANAPPAIRAASLAANPFPASPPPSQKSGKGGAIGALVGAAGGAAVAYWAASHYGENAPGEVCTRCFWQWSAFAIPVGAIVGYAVGYAIAPQRSPRPHQALVTPVLGRRGGAVVVSVRY
jgi:hypothetical protein